MRVHIMVMKNTKKTRATMKAKMNMRANRIKEIIIIIIIIAGPLMICKTVYHRDVSATVEDADEKRQEQGQFAA